MPLINDVTGPRLIITLGEYFNTLEALQSKSWTSIQETFREKGLDVDKVYTNEEMEHIIHIVDDIINGTSKTNEKIQKLILVLFRDEMENPHVI